MNLLIGALLLNPRNRLSEGAKVNAISRLASILLGDFAIGSILDPLGNFIFNSGRIDVQYRWVVESPAPGIIDRQSLFEPRFNDTSGTKQYYSLILPLVSVN